MIQDNHFEENQINPETFPVQFLIICQNFCSIIDLSSRIVFLYESALEILDAFSLGLSQLVVVEKSTKLIKIFSNYVTGSRKFNEILVTDLSNSNYIESIACSRSLYENENSTEIDLVCHFRNHDLKYILIRYLNKMDRFNDFDDNNYIFLSDNVTIKFDSESETDDDSDDETEKLYKFTRINKYIEFSILKTIKSMGRKIERVIKIQDSYYAAMGEPFGKFNLTRTYISFTNGDLMILNLNARKKNRILAYLFRNLCPDPILKIEHSFSNDTDSFYMVFFTKNSVFLAHSNVKQNEYEKRKGICLFELKGKYDNVIYLNKNLFLVSSYGIIEAFKLNCLMNRHRTKHLFSINTHSKQITRLLIIKDIFHGKLFLQCGTADGVFNTYEILSAKRKVNILPSFDRTSDLIVKFYILESMILSVSKNK